MTTPTLTTTTADTQALDTPFAVELERLDETPGGYFRPGARLLMTPALRTSGLWHALPPEELKSLLLVLTFLTPNGWCRPTVQQLAAAMNTSEQKARARMERLAQIEFQGKPLVTELKRENGLDAWVASDTLLEIREAPPAPAAQMVPYRPARYGAVAAFSRSRYARPRAEVERQIAALGGWDLPGGDAEAGDLPPEQLRPWLQSRLLRLGVTAEQAGQLLDDYGPESVRRQIEWLPYRGAKSPARFLVAAIEGDYAPPASLRARMAPASEGTPAGTQHMTERECEQGPETRAPEQRRSEPAAEPVPVPGEEEGGGLPEHLPLP